MDNLGIVKCRTGLSTWKCSARRIEENDSDVISRIANCLWAVGPRFARRYVVACVLTQRASILIANVDKHRILYGWILEVWGQRKQRDLIVTIHAMPCS